MLICGSGYLNSQANRTDVNYRRSKEDHAYCLLIVSVRPSIKPDNVIVHGVALYTLAQPTYKFRCSLAIVCSANHAYPKLSSSPEVVGNDGQMPRRGLLAGHNLHGGYDAATDCYGD